MTVSSTGNPSGSLSVATGGPRGDGAWSSSLWPGVAAANLWIYRDAPGTVWTILRWVWATLLVLWVILNLFFWPFWFAEDEAHRTLRTTWRNALAFVSANPFPALFVAVIVFLLGFGELPLWCSRSVSSS